MNTLSSFCAGKKIFLQLPEDDINKDDIKNGERHVINSLLTKKEETTIESTSR